LKETVLSQPVQFRPSFTSTRLSADEHGATAIEDFNGLIALLQSRNFDADGHISTHCFVI
jgi:hypothetical protein